MRPPALLEASLILTLLIPGPVTAYKFGDCRDRVLSILNGTGDPIKTGPNSNISKDVLQRYLYNGPVASLDASYPREKYTALTLEGCRVLCFDPIDSYITSNPSLSLSIVANWILPIFALLACLPYDSLHSRLPGQPWHQGRIGKTVKTLLNWIGSPPTALTAILFNIYQIRKCRSYCFFSSGTPEQVRDEQTKKNAYYVLSCLNQFELPDRDVRQDFVGVVAYGLRKPLENPGLPQDRAQATRSQQAALRARELLAALAFQLRMHRRRGTYPAGINIVVFLVAFGVSVWLAFADLGQWVTAHSLALGLLMNWLPTLVMFSIVDRNPVSAVRSKILVERWLWNVEALERWESPRPPRPVVPPSVSAPPNLNLNVDSTAIDWWTPAKQTSRQGTSRHPEPPPPADAPAGLPNIFVPTAFSLGEFVGQGRKMGYQGLAIDILTSIYDLRQNPQTIKTIADKTGTKLNRRFKRPWAWLFLAVFSFFLFWWGICMAFLVSYQTPTVGLSCRSGSYLLYGLLASLAWVASLVRKNPGTKTRAVCYLINLLACLVLATIVLAQVTGLFNNCACKCGFAGYTDLRDAEFYRLFFGVETWWAIGAAVGGFAPVFCFVASAVLLRKLKVLWKASEQDQPSWELTDWGQGPTQRERETIYASMMWLT
ncbi:hypothetical protein C8A01DRAFT_14161 [Parachaetomium inaequale]|uniref:Uncharacterized protein n=1 Tax=Parachaetomium inaequale TaxID=2588326 RepID=A0AAN6PLF4_9PEZI|nr:hypothetical protein C8A01DRAFT_14161 [Parachaetomium inaequale]